MRRSCAFGLGLAAVVMALGALHFRGADGCAVAPPLGMRVQISDETAIIVWEAEKQLEHFIRSATFETDAKDFGFLVPTPSQPTLHEVDQGTFDDLARITAPKIVSGRGRAPREVSGCGCSSEPKISAAPNAPPPVRVLEETQVAGHDAAVLEADDADSLAAWLKEHDYPSSPELTEWLRPYIAEKWKITAFKYVKEESPEPKLASAAIRLTFKTQKPVYPYREPEAAERDEGTTANATKNRLLRVFFVGDSRYQGELGDEAEPWTAKTAWAGKLQDFQLDWLARRLKLDETDKSATWWLTEFEDRSSPRPTERELYFSPAKDQNPIERPPIHAAHQPRGDAAIYLAAVGMLAVYAYGVRRRRT